MDFIEAAGRSEKSGFQKFLSAAEGEEVSIEGAVHSVRNMGEIGFVVLRRREGLIQAVWEKGKTKLPLSSVHQGDVLSVSGMVRNEERAPFGRELCVEQAGYLYEKAEEEIIQAAETDARRYEETLRAVSLSDMAQIPVTLK